MKYIATLMIAFFGFIQAAEPFMEKQDLFIVGEDPAYSLYHIPGIVVTAKGTVLSWCEARRRAAGVSDWDDIRILLRHIHWPTIQPSQKLIWPILANNSLLNPNPIVLM